MEISGKKIAKFVIITGICLTVIGFFLLLSFYLGIKFERARMSDVALELDSIDQFDDDSNLSQEIDLKVD